MSDTRCTRCGTDLGPEAVKLEATLKNAIEACRNWQARAERGEAERDQWKRQAEMLAPMASHANCAHCEERKAQRNAERLRNQVKP